MSAGFWDNLFGRLQTDCGYTPAQIRAMTLHDLRRLFAHWRRYPPLRDLVAGFVGFRSPADDGEPPPADGGEMLVRMFPDGQMRI